MKRQQRTHPGFRHRSTHDKAAILRKAMRMKTITILAALITFLAPALGTTIVDDLSGVWIARAVTPQGPLELELELENENGELIGSIAAFDVSMPLTNLNFDHPNLSLKMNLAGMDFELSGVLTDGKFSGTWRQVAGEMQGTWTAERKAEQPPIEKKDITGVWDALAETPAGELEMVLDVVVKDGKISGTLSSDLGSLPIQSASLHGTTLTFEIDLAGTVYRTSSELGNDTLTGEWVSSELGDGGAWSATKRAAIGKTDEAEIAGVWDSIAVTPGGDLKMVLEIERSGESLTGTLGSEVGTAPIQSATFTGNELRFEIDLGGILYHTEAKLIDNRLSGRWSDADGVQGGQWHATRRQESLDLSSIAGTWSSIAATANGDVPFELVFESNSGGISGNTVLPEGDRLRLNECTFKGGRISFEVNYFGTKFRLQATLSRDKLAGTWEDLSSFDSGKWSAERSRP